MRLDHIVFADDVLIFLCPVLFPRGLAAERLLLHIDELVVGVLQAKEVERPVVFTRSREEVHLIVLSDARQVELAKLNVRVGQIVPIQVALDVARILAVFSTQID